MKNRLPFAALTFAFTIAGSAVSYGAAGNFVAAVLLTGLIAFIGGLAAAMSGET
jgi:hypothetical protein